MDYEKHFVKGTFEFKVEDLEFEYKRKNCGDESRWVPHCMQDVPKGRVLNPALMNLWRCTNLVKVPWKKEDLKLAIGVEKEWNELSELEKFEVFDALNPKLGNKIILKISDIEEVEEKKV